MTIEQIFSNARNFDAKNVELNREAYAVELYRNMYLDESAAASYIVGFVGAGGRGAPIFYAMLGTADMLSLCTLSHSSEGQPIFRLDFSKMQREVLKGAFSVLCYNGKHALDDMKAQHGIKNAGKAFEMLIAEKFPTFEHIGNGADTHIHGDDFRTPSGTFIGCKFADGARVMLSDEKQSAFENAYGMNPWHDASKKEEE